MTLIGDPLPYRDESSQQPIVTLVSAQLKEGIWMCEVDFRLTAFKDSKTINSDPLSEVMDLKAIENSLPKYYFKCSISYITASVVLTEIFPTNEFIVLSSTSVKRVSSSLDLEP